MYNYFVWIFFIMLTSCACNSRSKEIKTYNSAGKLDNIKYFKNDNDTLNYYVKYFREDGTINCEGQKTEGKKNGAWKYYNSNKIIESIEKFRAGLLSDTQTYFFPDGQLDRYRILDQPIACFCDTPCYNSFTQVAYWRNGKLREISHMKNCEFDGKPQLYDSITGMLYKEFFENNGQLNGLYKMFYSDGSVMFGNYKDGQPIGKWKTLKGDSLISEKEYAN